MDWEKTHNISQIFLQDWEKTHNIYCLLETQYTEKTVVEDIAKFLRESRIAKALTDKTLVYQSHVRRFWNSARYEEEYKMIYSAVTKRDENGQDVDLEIKINVGDVRRVLDLGDSNNDPTIIPERLAKGLWCRMGFIGHVNGEILKISFSHAYKFLVHCVVHALSHRKGAYDETSDYIVNIITCLILNRPYNVSQVIFDYMVENAKAGNKKYIMYPSFVQMLIDDKFKDLEKSNDDILGLRHMTAETICRLIKGPNPGAKRMICRINNPSYIAPENDAWRHQGSDFDNEEAKIRPSVEPQQRLVDETVLEPSKVIEQGAGLLKQSLESYLKRNEEVAAQKEQSSSAQPESVQAEGVVQNVSSEDDSEATESELELDPTTLGRGKAKLKKKPTKKQKASDEEDSSYEPDDPKKQIKKCKAVQVGVIPRRVRAKKSGAEPPKDKGGKKEKHLEKSKVHEAEKVQSVEVEVQKKTGGDDYVEITGYKVATPPCPLPQDQPESSHPKDITFDYLFEGLPLATGIFREDIPEDDYDMFNNEAVKELLKKVANLEKKRKLKLKQSVIH
ncbi:hypothetical protein Hanom_Chr13g01200681 [Helianthus anomalus]